MKRKFLSAAVLLLGILSATFLQAGEKPTIAAPCTSCHEAQPNVLRGTFQSASGKALAIQMQIGPATWLVKFDEDTSLEGAESIGKIPKEKEIAITYELKNGQPVAKSITLKPPAKIPPEKLMGAEEVLRLVEADKGDYVLVDSRPAPRYHEGHIPTALSMPLPAFEKMKDKVLPQEKNKLVIFYCGGVT